VQLSEQASNLRSRASLAVCYAATDLEWRLRQIPDSAMSRGIFFNMLDAQAATLSPAVHDDYRRFFRTYRFSPFRMYPTSDFLTRLVLLAQMSWGADRIFEGIHALQASAFDAYSSTIVGRAALAVIQPDLGAILPFMARNWRSSGAVNYSDMLLVESRPERHRVRFVNEYVYIEHAMVGALAGLSRLCGANVRAECELESPFHGVVTLHVDDGDAP
jgi:uncharacterized protein (TIGR02265 family)